MDALIKAEHALRGELEALGVEDRGADVAMQANQREVRRVERALRRAEGGARGQRDAELLVLVRGGDELMRVGVHAGLDADHHRLHAASRSSNAVETGKLLFVVQDHVGDAVVHAQLEVLILLVVAVRGHALGRETRGER